MVLLTPLTSICLKIVLICFVRIRHLVTRIPDINIQTHEVWDMDGSPLNMEPLCSAQPIQVFTAAPHHLVTSANRIPLIFWSWGEKKQGYFSQQMHGPCLTFMKDRVLILVAEPAESLEYPNGLVCFKEFHWINNRIFFFVMHTMWQAHSSTCFS